jgi:dTMP kinase
MEGIDASGKTTLSNALAAACREADISCRQTSEPSDSSVGQLIRDHGSDFPPAVQTLLFAADRYLHQHGPILGSGYDGVVICDRYVDSTIAYQAPKLAADYDVDLSTAISYVERCHRPWLREPDLTVFVDTAPDTAYRRIHDPDDYEDPSRLEAAYSVYQRLYKDSYDRVITVDGEQERDAMIDSGVRKVMDEL